MNKVSRTCPVEKERTSPSFFFTYFINDTKGNLKVSLVTKHCSTQMQMNTHEDIITSDSNTRLVIAMGRTGCSRQSVFGVGALDDHDGAARVVRAVVAHAPQESPARPMNVQQRTARTMQTKRIRSLQGRGRGKKKKNLLMAP